MALTEERLAGLIRHAFEHAGFGSFTLTERAHQIARELLPDLVFEIARAGHRSGRPDHDCFLMRCHELPDDLARAQAETRLPDVEDLADTLCYLRRHGHQDDSSCDPSRHRARAIRRLLESRHDYRAQAAAEAAAVAAEPRIRRNGHEEAQRPLVGGPVRSKERHWLRDDDVRRSVCGDFVGEGRWAVDTGGAPTCRACLTARPVG